MKFAKDILISFWPALLALTIGGTAVACVLLREETHYGWPVAYTEELGPWSQDGCHDEKPIRLKLGQHGSWEYVKMIRDGVRPCRWCRADVCACQGHCLKHGGKCPDPIVREGQTVCECLD